MVSQIVFSVSENWIVVVSIECMGRLCMQRAGLELMDMMAVYQEGAYERLCRYISVSF